ncbi:MAG: DUF2784 domain-containing protein [Gemmatimonadota bacterium]|nr:DUF2784 domain-containing protein [Gemmatimonadota bacterium]
MIQRILADLVVVVHFAFIVFVILGGLLALRWRRAMWLHLPAAAWGFAIEAFGWICPLTPLENRLRRASGEAGYPGGFIEHYLIPIMYPAGLTRGVQWVLAGVVVLVNVALYTLVWRRHRSHQPDDFGTRGSAER